MKTLKTIRSIAGLCAATALSLAAAGCGPDPEPGPDPAGFQETVPVNMLVMNFRWVPGTGDAGFQRDATEANRTIITNGYWIGETEVTQEVYMAVMGVDRSVFQFQGAVPGETGTPDKLPAEWVSWYAAIAFCNKLSLLAGKEPVYSVIGITDWAGLAHGDIPTDSNPAWNSATWDRTKNGYRLPTEMEWMWAAMGATAGRTNVLTDGWRKGYAGSWEAGGAIENIDRYAWYGGNASAKTHKVGTKNANELGLYDMSGNVWEWVWDRLNGDYPSGTWTDAGGGPWVRTGGSGAAVRTTMRRAARLPIVEAQTTCGACTTIWGSGLCAPEFGKQSRLRARLTGIVLPEGCVLRRRL